MIFDRRCENLTAMAVRCLPMDDRRGAEIVVAIAKMTYAVSALGAARVDYTPVRLGDAGAGRSIRYPSDYLSEKPGTDVLLLGTAYPPSPTATEMSVRVAVSTATGVLLEKTARVYGERVFYQSLVRVVPSAPALLCPTPLVWERTYGGRDETHLDRIVVERRNPVGVGFAVDRGRLVGTVAPQIEDPQAPLSSQSPAPACFGPVAADWEPRARLAGIADEAWRRERAPLPPLDFDPRHNSCAPEGLWSETPLVGDEAVEVIGATPDGAWRFRLPRYSPLFGVTLRGRRRPLPTHLDTLLIDADERRVELTWRAWFELPKKSEHVDAIHVVASHALSDEVWGVTGVRSRPVEPIDPSRRIH